MATLVPAGLMGLAVVLGGPWALAAVAYMTVLVACLDRFVAQDATNADPEAEFPAAQTLLVAIAILHVCVLVACVWAVGGASGLSGLDRVLIVIAGGLMMGQISHPAAHELIHKPGRALRLLGRLIYSTMLIGHHASAHLRIHHVHVGSDADPNSARRGEGFYRYMLRASVQSFRSGLRAETKAHRQARKPLWRHPYMLYAVTAAATLALSILVGGWVGLAGLLAVCIYAQAQIYLSDYVQHYGLRRAVLPDGRLEPVGPQHSWNAPHWYSSALMLNAPRHSDHHVSPARPFPALQLDPERMPYLPHPVPVMAVLALVPPVWKRVMNPLCDRWQANTSQERPKVTARDIPHAVLARAKSGGIVPGALAQSGHASHLPDPVPDPSPAGAGPKPDERGGV